MPRITCPCGVEFDASKANARYCSDRCRKRTKRSGAEVASLPVKPEPVGDPRVGPVQTAAIAELTQAQRLESAIGQQAIRLAIRLDNGLMETGSAFASLSKEFREVMAVATRGAGRATSPQQLRDELAERRTRHGA